MPIWGYFKEAICLGKMVGFDIGERDVKMVYSVDGRVKKMVSVSLPDNMVENGVIRSMDAMADFLRFSAKKNGIPLTNAAVILPDALVFCRNAQLPVMTGPQLVYNLPYEFKDYLSLEKDKYFYDYCVYSIIETDENRQMDLFCCAVLKSTIADYRAMFRRAGFKLKKAIPEEWAYMSVLRSLDKTVGTFCFADLGHNQTRVHIFSDNRWASRRIIDQGVGTLETQISNELLTDIHVARNYVLSDFNGVLSTENAVGLYDRVGIEILKTVNFHNYNNREDSLQTVYLVGGGSNIVPLRESISRVSGLDVVSCGQLDASLEGREVYLKAMGCAISK